MDYPDLVSVIYRASYWDSFGYQLENKLNAATWTSRLAGLYITVTWCGPFCFISPLYTSLAGNCPKVVLLKVEIDEARDLAARWNGILAVFQPSIFLKNGKEIDQVVAADRSSLESKIAQFACQL
ncbi:unnamed protein product [Ilex paraguariensis]|uniref:Thioredoxin domain-containing protein n=1 Tax=Ilex paraguariensis TaxID=185542 RepID=A0ABC8SV90_9AQUA